MDKIICVGKNYLKHAIELGGAVPEEPLYFIKPPSSLCANTSAPIEIPTRYEVHHELELVYRLTQRKGKWTFSHFTLGLDLTLRDLQANLKKNGQPWEKAKVFKNSAICGPWLELPTVADTLNMEFALQVNGEIRQKGFGRDMRWKPEETLTDLQRWFPLCEGDLLFTGTPEGVGQLKPGDRAKLSGPVSFDIEFAAGSHG